ncbi:DUF3307 domain-containing protein [Streptomyces cavernicola]|uniref:DUF3307 domain-containing protein n=1 Tax=Streptomyces cavernicola TaxID=3043613 RepID=A0ABT6SF04_9ACTN|nr:DUF3307 domain-containing protein [Streptomyces sp. B-S-A6]MDI3406043.1 DUF3307 domain-containing protein [Streptomyces sp. B-S-A6]
MFASLFVLLYVAHLLSDYPLQTDHQAKHKAGAGTCGWRANAAHAATHVAVTTAALAAGIAVLGLDVNLAAAAGAVLWIGVTHSVIDRRWPVARWMAFARQARFAQHGGAAHVDQTAHLTALAIAALAIAGLS